MGEGQFSALLTVVVPPIVKLVADWEGNGEVAAMESFYCSKVYAELSDEASKMWRLSPRTIFGMYRQEKQRGGLTGRRNAHEQGIDFHDLLS